MFTLPEQCRPKGGHRAAGCHAKVFMFHRKGGDDPESEDEDELSFVTDYRSPGGTAQPVGALCRVHTALAQTPQVRCGDQRHLVSCSRLRLQVLL
jgi:hypothetical protein